MSTILYIIGLIVLAAHNVSLHINYRKKADKAYQEGYEFGQDVGHQEGYQEGYLQGYRDAEQQ